MKVGTVMLGVFVLALAGCDAAANDTIIDPQFSLHEDGLDAWVSSGKVAIADPFRPEVPASYRYHAKLDKNGTKGTFEYITELLTGELSAQGQVVCMGVVELPNGVKKARFGGIITQSNRSEFPAGSAFIWNVTDESNANDKEGEFASPLLGFDPTALRAHCEAGGFYPESPVDGHIHLHKTGSGN